MEGCENGGGGEGGGARSGRFKGGHHKMNLGGSGIEKNEKWEI